MPGAREARAAKTRHRALVGRIPQSLHQPERIDQEGTDDGWVQALVVQHQHRIVQPGLRIHDKATRAGPLRHLAQVRRHVALPMHQRHVQVRKRSHAAAAAVRWQARDGGPLQQEGQQLGLGKDPGDQFAVLEVIAGQGRFILREAAVDLRHPLIRVVDGLALAEQGLRHALQAEGREIPGSGPQRLDPVDDQAAGGGGKEMVLLEAVLAPLQHIAAPAE